MSVSADRQAEIAVVVAAVPNLATNKIVVTNGEEQTEAQSQLSAASKPLVDVDINANQTAVVWRAISQGPATETATVLIRDLDLTEARIHDDVDTFLPESAGTDDLGMIEGTFGTTTPTIKGVDFGGTTGLGYARWPEAELPEGFVAGMDLTIRVHGGMLTTVSDGTATVDLVVYAIDGDGTPGATDLCTTAAQSINSLTKANKDFTIDSSGLTPGSKLDIRLALAGADTGNVGVMEACATRVQLRAS